MRILEVLTYYRPHVSGLTIYVERLSKALAAMGHDVTVLTSQYDKTLPIGEMKDGVNIRRVPVAFRISKGVIMPRFGPTAWTMVRHCDIVHLHLPQLDAPGVALRGRLLGKPVILTYHSDLRLPDGLLNRFIDRVVHAANRVAGNLSDAVVTYTYDFGSHSRFLRKYLDTKLHVIPPPVELESASANDVQQFKQKHTLAGKRVIGISARLAAEKGIEVLLNALPIIQEEIPEAFVLHANPDAIGESAYAERIRPLIEQYQDSYLQLGSLHGAELTAFYKNLDCLVMCSLNNTETFGLVQIEAMMNGVPVVASDLPGVRQPVIMTGMGEIAPLGDHLALAAAINRILTDRQAYLRDPALIAKSFNPRATAGAYLHLFDDLLQGKHEGSTEEPAAYEQLRQASR